MLRTGPSYMFLQYLGLNAIFSRPKGPLSAIIVPILVVFGIHRKCDQHP